jgi:hypothetical protein
VSEEAPVGGESAVFGNALETPSALRNYLHGGKGAGGQMPGHASQRTVILLDHGIHLECR